MVTRVAICGDSFACGIGMPFDHCFEKSFGSLVASHFNVPYNIYARGGCCNYVIYLQVKKVIEDYKHKEKPLVLITTTNHSRFIIPSDHAGSGYNNYTLEDVEYNLHEPYSDRCHEFARPLPFTPSKKPKLVSETVSNLIYFIKGKAPNLKYLFSDVSRKLAAVKTYYEELYDDEIKQTYDTGLILMMHMLLKEAGFPHLIMTANRHDDRFINAENYMHNDWGYYSRTYPDTMGSGHCTEQGHTLVAEKIIEKVNK